MAGFYIHIPFCRKVCYYCDFHFVASLKSKDNVLKAIIKEIELRSNDWKNETFETIYFGGGTPSILSIEEIVQISKIIRDNYNIKSYPEFTLEANPDDLTRNYLQSLKQNTDVNRLSIGIQSFNDDILKYMNRRHTDLQAIESVKNAQKAGFENITIDLIYGVPGLQNKEWESTVHASLDLKIQHLAAYHLSIEPKTVFGVMQKQKKMNPVAEEISLAQYKFLVDKMREAGYEHYEISNFAHNKMYSKHNTSYWKNVPYIGIGPSAHSFDGNKRRWNISNNSQYSNCLLNSFENYFEEENLTTDEKFNDYILTSLRTMWGANLDYINENYGKKYSDYCKSVLSKREIAKDVEVYSQNFRIKEKSWLIADYLMSEFFMV
jgi:oxygen-independent coproporphyrinogen-3 oxidase